MNINSVLNQSSRAIGIGNNIKSQKSQNTGFEAFILVAGQTASRLM